MNACMLCGKPAEGQACRSCSGKKYYDHPSYAAARRRLPGRKCVGCGAPATELDHIMTVREAARKRLPAALVNHPDNLRPVCRECHLARHGRGKA